MDIVSDALTRIKNGYMAARQDVLLPYSKLVLSILEVLQKEGYIGKSKVVQSTKGNFNEVRVILKYEGKRSALTEVKRISKPGLRVYKGKDGLPRVLNGLGAAIISTPKGVMTDSQARKEGVGGEILAYVW